MGITFGFIDGFVLFVLLISGLIAFYRGFIKEALGLSSWILAILAGLYGLPILRPIYSYFLKNPIIIDICSGISVSILVLVLCTILLSRINKRIRESSLSGLDRIFGFIFGIVRGLLIILLVYVLAIIAMPGEIDKAKESNMSLGYIEEGIEELSEFMPEYLTKDLEGRKKEAEEIKEERLKAGEKVFNKLNNPRPIADEKEESGYDETERKDLDGLINAIEEDSAEE